MTPAELMSAVRARLDELEQVARLATEGPWMWIAGRVFQEHPEGRIVIPTDELDRGLVEPSDLAHIALHDPAAVLRRVTADREILAEHSPYALATSCYCSACGDVPQVMFPCATLRALARGLGIDLERILGP